jgi:Transglutaminase elicitor
MKYLILIISIIQVAYSQPQGKWMKSDDPILILEKNYQQKFIDLPLKGKLDMRPWSDTYWATYKGGISYRWSKSGAKSEITTYPILKREDLSKMDIGFLSPSEKYDLFVGDYNFTLTKMERDRTEVMSGKNIPLWWGLCHDWAPATMIYNSPGPITVKNQDGMEIPFYASDIKALLVYNLELQANVTKNYFMGSRCELRFPNFLEGLSNGRISSDKFLKLIGKEECADMDPGAVHLALATLIGIRKTGLVMDKTRGNQIWNQPIYAYESRVLDTRIPKRPIKGEIPNLDVAKILTIETNIVYVKEIEPNKDGKNIPKNSLKDLKYKYEIFLNKEGNIIGGKWLSLERPDFFWRIEDPGFNPSFQLLAEIYKNSISLSANEARTLSKEQVKGLFKSTAKKIINAQRVFRNPKEAAVAREVSRKEHYERLKFQMIKRFKEIGSNLTAP